MTSLARDFPRRSTQNADKRGVFRASYFGPLVLPRFQSLCGFYACSLVSLQLFFFLTFNGASFCFWFSVSHSVVTLIFVIKHVLIPLKLWYNFSNSIFVSVGCTLVVVRRENRSNLSSWWFVYITKSCFCFGGFLQYSVLKSCVIEANY